MFATSYLIINKRSFLEKAVTIVMLSFLGGCPAGAQQQDKAKTSPQDTHIINVVKDYLLTHPEFMLEVEKAFSHKQEKERKLYQREQIAHLQNEIYHNKNDIILGNSKGQKTIVEFFDYNCTYCKKNFTEIKALLNKDPDIRLILKDLPILSADSVRAHMVAHAFYILMPQKFDIFFQRMMQSASLVDEATALNIATSLGANKKELLEKMQDAKITAGFIENNKLAYKLKINGTPAYIVKDEIFPGAVDQEILAAKLK